MTEDITGAIADSINYTIDELRTPGGGHQRRRAAGDHGDAGGADDLRRSCSRPPQTQADEIQGAGQSVLQMAQSMNEVSNERRRLGARSRSRSLAAADKGARGGAERDHAA